jgi:hypothetical protein
MSPANAAAAPEAVEVDDDPAEEGAAATASPADGPRLCPNDEDLCERLVQWVTTQSTPTILKLWDVTRVPRRYLPDGRAGKLAVAILRALTKVVKSAPRKHAQPAEAFLVALPLILLAKGGTVHESALAIMDGKAPPAQQDRPPLSAEQRLVAALRDAVVGDDRRGVLRALDRAQSASGKTECSLTTYAASRGPSSATTIGERWTQGANTRWRPPEACCWSADPRYIR